MEQFHSETFGNAHVRLLLERGGLDVEGADWLFGPLLFASHLAEEFWLSYDGQQYGPSDHICSTSIIQTPTATPRPTIRSTPIMMRYFHTRKYDVSHDTFPRK